MNGKRSQCLIEQEKKQWQKAHLMLGKQKSMGLKLTSFAITLKKSQKNELKHGNVEAVVSEVVGLNECVC